MPYRRARATVGRSDLRWHDLRHTGQSLAGIRELQARAGHSTASAAIRYIHRFAGADQRVADSLDALARADDEHDK
jgi:integrase